MRSAFWCARAESVLLTGLMGLAGSVTFRGEVYEQVPGDSTMHTRTGTQGARAATAATDDSTLTVQTQHLAGPATGVVVRSLLNPEGGKGCFKRCVEERRVGAGQSPRST